VRRAGPLREKGVGMAESVCRCGSIQLASTDRRQALCAALCAAGFFSSLPRQAFAEARQMAPLPEDEAFMRMALAEAAKGDFPFGAVIVRESEVLAKGRNLGKTNNDPTAHGEMVAIRNIVAERPAQEFAKTTLYTSGEPCAMCISAIIWCGIARVVFAASVEELATRIGQIMLASRTVANAAPFADIAITGGVLSSEALALFPK
jgi:tRNA(adenine34) deaminase